MGGRQRVMSQSSAMCAIGNEDEPQHGTTTNQGYISVREFRAAMAVEKLYPEDWLWYQTLSPLYEHSLKISLMQVHEKANFMVLHSANYLVMIKRLHDLKKLFQYSPLNTMKGCHSTA